MGVCFQGDPGVPGFKGEAGPKGEPVSLHVICKMKRGHRGCMCILNMLKNFMTILMLFFITTSVLFITLLLTVCQVIIIMEDKPQ